MGKWQGAWLLAKYELRRSKKGYFMSAIFLIYLLIFLLPLIYNALSRKANDDGVYEVTYWTIDFIYICLLSIIGLFIGKLYMNYWKNDPLGKKLALWRTLPITSEHVVYGKLIQTTIGVFLCQIPFYSAFYFMIYYSDLAVSLDAFIFFFCLWLTISFLILFFVIYLELVKPGKIYSIIYFSYMLIIMIAIATYSFFARNSLVLLSLQQFEEGNYSWLIVAVVVTAAVYIVGLRFTVKQLDNRDYFG